MIQLIPLTPTPNDQYFSTSLNIDGGILVLQHHLHFNEMAQYWTDDISDQQGNLLLSGIPFVTAANILEQFGYLLIGSAAIYNAGSVAAPPYPNAYDLGSDFNLIWGDTPTA